jgi:hypothetical protein
LGREHWRAGSIQVETYFLCDALIAATFSFFSAMRFAIRALKMLNVSFKRQGGKRRDALILRLLLFLMFQPANLKSVEMATALKAQWGD